MQKKCLWIACLIFASTVIAACAAVGRPEDAGGQELGISSSTDEAATSIQSLDDFYSTEWTKGRDIRTLGEAYDSFDAQKDQCFVIGAMVHNDGLYGEFMEGCAEKRASFVRVAQNTSEGDLFLYDILYDDRTDKLYLVTDHTRDRLLAEEDRQITLQQFEYIAEYSYQDHVYWVLYNGHIDDSNFESSDVFIITLVN